jgi:hypothetical protein
MNSHGRKVARGLFPQESQDCTTLYPLVATLKS